MWNLFRKTERVETGTRPDVGNHIRRLQLKCPDKPIGKLGYRSIGAI